MSGNELIVSSQGWYYGGSYQEHHIERVAAVAAVDTRIQFELDTTDPQQRQLMLIKTVGANAKVVMVQRLPALELGRLLSPPTPLSPPPLPPPPSHPSLQVPQSGGLTDSKSSKALRFVRAKKSAPALGEALPPPPPHQLSVPLPPPPPPPLSAAAIAAGAALAKEVLLKATFVSGGSSGSGLRGAESWAARAGGGSNEPAPQLDLCLPRQLLQILGERPQLPHWTEGMCLMEFLPAAAAAVQSVVDCEEAGQRRRCALIDAISHLAGPPTACDRVTWRDASWLVSIQDTVVNLQTTFPRSFPATPPKLTLQVPEEQGGIEELHRPAVQYCEYGWSQVWDGAESARRIFDHLESTAPQWKGGVQPPQGFMPQIGLQGGSEHQSRR